MEDSTQLWEAWKLAKAYSRRPSEIYGIRDEVAAWCFDRAVHLFGSELDAALEEAVSGARSKQQAAGRQMRILSKWLGGPMRFKDPASEGTSEGSGPVKL